VPEPYAQVLDFIMEGDHAKTERVAGESYHVFYARDVPVGFCPATDCECGAGVRRTLRRRNELLRKGASLAAALHAPVNEAARVPLPVALANTDPVRRFPKECYTKVTVPAVPLPPPFNFHFVIPDKNEMRLMTMKKLGNTMILLKELRGMTSCVQIRPEDNHEIFRVLGNFELYQRAILIFGQPDRVLRATPGELRTWLTRRLTHVQALVYLVKNKALAPNLVLSELDVDFGKLEGDKCDLFVELCAWVRYLREGDYFGLRRNSPLYNDIRDTLLSTAPVFTVFDDFHEVMMNSRSRDGMPSFLRDVSDKLPWHPPIMRVEEADREKFERLRKQAVSHYAPTWEPLNHLEQNVFYEFLQNSKRQSPVYRDAVRWWEREGGRAEGMIGKEPARPKSFEGPSKSRETLNVYAFVSHDPVMPVNDDNSVNVKVTTKGTPGAKVMEAYQCLRVRGGLARDAIRMNVVIVFRDKAAKEACLYKRSTKYPHLTRTECIVLATIGRKLMAMHAPTIYHTYTGKTY